MSISAYYHARKPEVESDSVQSDRSKKMYLGSDGIVIKTKNSKDGEIVRTVPKPKSIFD